MSSFFPDSRLSRASASTQDAGTISALPFSFPLFPDLDALLATFSLDSFRALPAIQRLNQACIKLLEQIDRCPAPTFLLPAVLDYMQRFNQLQLDTSISFSLFEFWLNHFSHLSLEAQGVVRGKIAGKYIPREQYSLFFPISLGKTYPGSHFVSAHLSPDLDTTVASFIGWLDAFAARVGTGQHLWNLPGGASQPQIKALFTKLFGPAFFSLLAHTEGSMRLSAMDLITTDSILYAKAKTTLTHLDHNMGATAILYVDEQGYYQGDWRGSNFEPVEQITALFDRILRYFSHAIHVDLLALFAQEEQAQEKLQAFYADYFSKSLESILEIEEQDSAYKERLNLFCVRVLELEEGLQSSFLTLFTRLSALPLAEVALFLQEIEQLPKHLNELKAVKGGENQAALFRLLYRLVHALDRAVDAISSYIDRLDVVMRIKHDVLGYQPQCVTLRSDLDTLRLSLGERDHLTVVSVDEIGRRLPVGIVQATTLRKEILGTASQRDFSNPEEMRMAPYLSVISVIDHHKSVLNTQAPAQTLIADVQSCNVLVAEQSFVLNDRHGTGGLSVTQVTEQIQTLFAQGIKNGQESRLLQRLLAKQSAIEKRKEVYIHPLREYVEYFYFLHAILDDTDLLSKAGMRDLACVCSLLNRLKSLCTGVETEVVSLDDLMDEPDSVKQATRRLLESPDLNALYVALHRQREQEIEKALELCVEKGDLALFADTKQQNGCCRIGQIKLFAGNQPIYQRYHDKILERWLDESEKVNQAYPEYDLHLMMISTLSSLESCKEAKGPLASCNQPEKEIKGDELWIWVAPTLMGMERLARFLNAWHYLPLFQKQPPQVTLYAPENASEIKEWQEVFAQNFRIAQDCRLQITERQRCFAILHYPHGVINSRKTMISPFLPTLVGSKADWS